MNHRDWARGEDDPRERQPVVPWDVPAAPSRVHPYEHDAGQFRTPSRRRAAERGQREPVDPYLPRWALESGVRSPDGGGRHAAPDDEDDADRPRPDGGRWATETARGWHRAGEAGGREIPAAPPESDHTGEWTFDGPREGGYSGRRRADDDPVSGAPPQGRPRRSPSDRPQVVWSGLEEPSDAARATPVWDRDRSGRWTAEDGPAVDRWDRPARRAEPADRPEFDPWDASGVHAWRPVGEVDRWGGSGDAGRWDRTDASGRWHQPDGTGQWERYADGDGWEPSDAPRSGDGAAEGWPWPGRDDPDGDFWWGTRLAGDDPRWMDPPASVPRSPAVSYTAPRPRTAPRRRAAEPVGPSRGATAAPVRRRSEVAAAGGLARRIEDDLLDPDPGGRWRPLLYTVACYLVPAVLIFFWLLTLDGQVPEGCVTDINGEGCDSPRSRALGSLASGLPRFGLALASSLVVAMLLRRVGTTWRPATVALASAVVGGGLSTVMISVVTGQPIG
ncbi:hypothetical protein GA0070606_3303 [Micromonospora citrea]|uniref:Uncharacterized protein n=1 Tax=Micromonospora citrea TaxID=47855 RepID=A0A1C6V2P7_9ACTN|nr:hypothetical protein [Micromonospora citrea]SCL60621.1 hypothetical protein GA0070606_3303 [Micromonospora citrea]